MKSTSAISNYDRNYVVANASHNYWGTSNISEIARSIYDNEDDPELRTVTFRPYLGSINYSDVEDEGDASVTTTVRPGHGVNDGMSINKITCYQIIISNAVTLLSLLI